VINDVWEFWDADSWGDDTWGEAAAAAFNPAWAVNANAVVSPLSDAE
jgi:hypothetical protein